MKKLLCLLLAAILVFSFAACGDKKEEKEEENPTVYTDPYADMDVQEQSDAIYDVVLGEYYTAYQEALEATTNAERFAKMAIAEAKLLESGVILPLSSQGGNYAIGRVAPNTAPKAYWGNDSDRYHNIVVTEEIITSEDRTAMKTKYAELKGTGTYEAWAKQYLTEKGYTLKDTYALTYSSDPKTWAIQATYRSADSEAIVNTFDSLLEYDCEGVLQPALAESYEVSEDGTVYTFHIRQGVLWVDSQGRTIEELTADSFVAGLQFLLDSQGGTEYLVSGIIKNVDEYMAGTASWEEVGIKAVDEYTLQYTLCDKCSYFVTMLEYNPFAPLSRKYFLQCGGAFGIDAFAEASAKDSYTYGTDPDHIAYCGPYLVTSLVKENSIVFEANPKYWNKDNINIKKITWMFNDGNDVLKPYKDMLAGTIDGTGLNASALEEAKKDGNFDKYGYTSSTDATCYTHFFNVNRTALANFNDETACVSTQTADDALRTLGASRNVHFRRAVMLAIDRKTYNAQGVGEELALVSVTNSYTPGDFVQLDADVTVSIGGKDVTFAAGTYYGEVMQAQIDADGFDVQVWDPEGNDGLGSSMGFDGWYNVEAAKAELEIAIEELKKVGITIDAEHPIMLDIPYPSNSTTYTNRENACKKSIEDALGGLVVVNLTECKSYSEWYYAGYYADNGNQSNFNLYDCSGWGPDFGDPSTYLNTMIPDGDMIKSIGIY